MSVVLPYSIMFKTFVKKPTIMSQTKKKETEESFKLFTKPRREMAITIKKKKSDRPFFRKSFSSVFQEKKKKKWFNVTKYSRQKIGIRRYFKQSFLTQEIQKGTYGILYFFFLRTWAYSHLTNIRFTCLSFFAFG